MRISDWSSDVCSSDLHLRSVVVATVPIAFGQMVEAQQVTTVRMPMDTIPDDAFDSSEQAVGKIATFDILRGDIVRGARLSEHLEIGRASGRERVWQYV